MSFKAIHYNIINMTSVLEASTIEQHNGIVKWFNKEKGFGIITYTNNGTSMGNIVTEYFVHHSDIKTPMNIRSYLIENEEVQFTPSSEPGGKLKAIDVKARTGSMLQCLANRGRPRNTRERSTDINSSRPPIQDSRSSTRQPKNTTSFKPQSVPCDIRLLSGWAAFSTISNNQLTTNDIVTLDPFMDNLGLFSVSQRLGGPKYGLPERTSEEVWFNHFNQEIDCVAKKYNSSADNLMKLWHGDSHLIADDKMKDGNWKQECPRLQCIIDSIANMYNMKVMSTRVNLYRDGTDWKPYHHDAAAIKDHIKKIQNITVAVNFGATRDVGFCHVKSGVTIDIPLIDGYIYSFGEKVNVDWKHGILRGPSNLAPRFSVILWGWVDQSPPQVY